MTEQILPGATLGVLGSGQLGRMFGIAARRLGYRLHVYSPDSGSPAGQVADREFSARYDDLDSLSEFARSVDVVTFEFENVPSAVTDCIERSTPVRPSGRVLGIAQNRLVEKSTLQNLGLPVPGFRAVRSASELNDAVTQLGTPCVIKTATCGYDGKGQAIIRAAVDCESTWQQLNTAEAIAEEFVPFECEVSVIGVRNCEGQFTHYGPFRNTHANHILDVTVAPAGLRETTERAAVEITRTILEQLDVVGVLCVEMFVTTDGQVLINELAPRPHNSGHLTIDAHKCCQFEQQVRSICGLPLGSSEQIAPAAMANLLGDLWNPPPEWSKLMERPGVQLHLYGKEAARPGRKMGHLTVLDETTELAEAQVREARSSLHR